MSGLNKAQVIGHLGSDPEMKYIASGQAVCEFSVATSENWKDKDGAKQERTEWHRIVVWGKTAEACSKYLAKGRQVYVEGRIQTRSWDKDGQKHYRTEIVATDVQFLGGGKGGEGRGGSHDAPHSAPSGGGSDFNSDIPFATCDLGAEPTPIAKVLR